ncbi:Glyoxalase-like domain-containing protein [Nocardioides exalbidus]|uniref:Glyoxalase-like domain-containing protein n=1 Tax=Nocardioides exalbidus TaxID=402596 RepID=A0A1H4VMJ1_9ACTN|nr:DUF6226 family protein [Nocardioides exalbidus]SEC81798.1 Glyoxalase-like domain-containing protein [Nocardioides exalbidus]
MAARFDHLVVAVEDLDEAAARWRAAGIRAERGGAHPVGTENVLVRGPGAAYVELIAPGSEESNPWLDRIRDARGPISWAIAVDDIDAAHAALVAAGFEPDPPTPGSRRTPSGDLVEWRVCDLAAGPYDDALPFLIEWATPMPPGPADGAVVESIALTPPDPDRVADVLLALGFVGNDHWPRRVFNDAATRVTISLAPLGEPLDLGGSSWAMSWDGPDDEPATSLGLSLPVGEASSAVLDGVSVSTGPDSRRFAASSLLPAVDAAFTSLRGDLADWPNPHPGGRSPLEEEYSRVLDPGKYRLLAVRADAWVEAITRTGLGTAEVRDPSSVRWLGERVLVPTRVTVLTGRPGTQPIVVAVAPSQSAEDAFVQVGVGEPVEVLQRQPDCGCDACDTGSADLLETLDDAFVLALSGGVYVVREGETVVRRSLDGWGSTGTGAGESWLAEAADGRRTDGVVRGDPWL